MTRRAVRAGYREMIDEATANRHDRALAVVQRLLVERGIRAHRHHTISLGFADRTDAPTWPGLSAPRSWTKRHPPELVVIDSQGRRDATVTIGPRSGCYLVSVRDGPDLQAFRQEQPQNVVHLIIATRRVPACPLPATEEGVG
ncbi:hypothetical protein [Streptosporangium sp. NPDC001681]|uniref:hypothetical protein n=1 Tax=Streptosporangium sp. NPDC001681 TaxID=3154395 RepID=UPI00331C76E8